MKPNVNDEVYRLINYHAQVSEQSSVNVSWRTTPHIYVPKHSHKQTNKKRK